MWLFGGSNSAGSLNDLWRYSATTGQWTWISGSSDMNAPGVYGSQGVAEPGNVPGARNLAVSWADGTGALWLFGGIGLDATGNSGNLNDLWKFDPNSNMWTWVGGSNLAGATGVYGTKGSPAPTNMPSARNSATSWIDAAGDLWLFGGFGISTGAGANLDYLNDLWEYNSASGEWVWVSGSDSYGVFAPVEYGTQGVAAADNIPGARSGGVSWTDGSGRLWLFGGYAFDSARNAGPINDLWSFNPSSGLWTWESGASTNGAAGIYGTQGVPAAANVPGARQEGTSWIDAGGTLWLFGGTGSGGFNDLWTYTPAGHQWTWVGGSNTTDADGVYGTKGIPSNSNVPGARYSPVAWMDATGNLWLFGGSATTSNSYDTFNDLWKYLPQ
jgi:N-acetylneuraminic acid mutarotase